MITRSLAFGACLLLSGLGVALADEMELQKQCDALGDAFTNYSATKTDPDMEQAKALAQEGMSNCDDHKKYEEGINNLNNAMGMAHDGVASGHSGRR